MGQLSSKDTAATKLPKQQPEHTSYLVALSRSENTQVSVETSGVSGWGRLLTGATDLAELQEGAGAGAGAARGDPRGGAAGLAPGGRLEAGVLHVSSAPPRASGGLCQLPTPSSPNTLTDLQALTQVLPKGHSSPLSAPSLPAPKPRLDSLSFLNCFPQTCPSAPSFHVLQNVPRKLRVRGSEISQ